MCKHLHESMFHWWKLYGRKNETFSSGTNKTSHSAFSSLFVLKWIRYINGTLDHFECLSQRRNIDNNQTLCRISVNSSMCHRFDFFQYLLYLRFYLFIRLLVCRRACICGVKTFEIFTSARQFFFHFPSLFFSFSLMQFLECFQTHSQMHCHHQTIYRVLKRMWRKIFFYKKKLYLHYTT